MADNDLNPPQIRNGGAGSISVGGVTAPDYRQLQDPAKVRTDLPDNGAASRAAALGSLFKEFENVSANVYDKFATEAGRQAGAEAGVAGNGAPKTGLQSITAYGQSYNAAVHATYVTQSQLSLEKSLTDIESDTQGDPAAFQMRASGLVQSALKSIDPRYQPEMTNWATARIQAGLNRQNQQKADDVRNTALATYQSATPDLITGALHTAAALPAAEGDAVIAKLVGDDKDKLDALVASRTITPEQSVRMHQKMIEDTHQQMTGQKVDISLQPVLQAMRTDVEAADKLIVQDDPNLTPDENMVRRQEFEKDRSLFVQTQSRARVDDLNAAHTALAAGSYGQGIEGQVRSLYKQGALSEEGYFSATAEAIRNQRDALELEAKLKLVDDAVHGTGPRLDPKDPNAKDAADKYFQAHVAIAGGVGDPQYAIGASEFVRQTGIVPKSVQGQIRVGLMSGDPNQTARAAALANKIRDANPEADVFVGTPKLAALSGLMTDNMNAGLPAAQALQIALATTDITGEQKKIRDQHYTVDQKTGGGNSQALQSDLQSRDGHFWNHAPQAPMGMQAAYDGLVHQFYTQTGDIAKAREIAGNQLRQTWGVSKVNGTPEYQQYPVPDTLVPAVRSDIAAGAKAAGYQGDPSALHLTSGANTTASAGRIWNVTYTDPQTGVQDVLLGKDNRPQQYTLPAPPDFGKTQSALAASKIAQAKALRDKERQESLDASAVEQRLSDYYLTPQGRRAEANFR